jgi:hypothetical protein
MKRLTAISFLLGLFCLFGAWSAFAQTDTEVKTATNDAMSGFSVVDALSNPLLTVRGDGNTGIGTATPSATLDVNGTAQIAAWKSQSLTDPGWARIGNVLIQWGSVLNNCAPAACTHNFPANFDGIFTIVGSLKNQLDPVEITEISLTQFTTRVSSGTPAVSWVAIGF